MSEQLAISMTLLHSHWRSVGLDVHAVANSDSPALSRIVILAMTNLIVQLSSLMQSLANNCKLQWTYMTKVCSMQIKADLSDVCDCLAIQSYNQHLECS